MSFISPVVEVWPVVGEVGREEQEKILGSSSSEDRQAGLEGQFYHTTYMRIMIRKPM